MITNLNRIKMNQTLRRGQDDKVKRRIPKTRKNRKVGTYNGRKHK